MNRLFVALGYVLLSGHIAADSFAQSPSTPGQPERMRKCNAQAGDRKGDERKQFMSACLKGEATGKPPAGSSSATATPLTSASPGARDTRRHCIKAFSEVTNAGLSESEWRLRNECPFDVIVAWCLVDSDPRGGGERDCRKPHGEMAFETGNNCGWRALPTSNDPNLEKFRIRAGTTINTCHDATKRGWSSTLVFVGCPMSEFEHGKCTPNARQYWKELGSPATKDATDAALRADRG